MHAATNRPIIHGGSGDTSEGRVSVSLRVRPVDVDPTKAASVCDGNTNIIMLRGDMVGISSKVHVLLNNKDKGAEVLRRLASSMGVVYDMSMTKIPQVCRSRSVSAVTKERRAKEKGSSRTLSAGTAHKCIGDPRRGLGRTHSSASIYERIHSYDGTMGVSNEHRPKKGNHMPISLQSIAQWPTFVYDKCFGPEACYSEFDKHFPPSASSEGHKGGGGYPSDGSIGVHGGHDRSSQEALFDEIGAPALRNLLDGFHSCILAYGQTGSGKTYTMLGPYALENDELGVCNGLDGRAVLDSNIKSKENHQPVHPVQYNDHKTKKVKCNKAVVNANGYNKNNKNKNKCPTVRYKAQALRGIDGNLVHKLSPVPSFLGLVDNDKRVRQSNKNTNNYKNNRNNIRLSKSDGRVNPSFSPPPCIPSHVLHEMEDINITSIPVVTSQPITSSYYYDNQKQTNNIISNEDIYLYEGGHAPQPRQSAISLLRDHPNRGLIVRVAEGLFQSLGKARELSISATVSRMRSMGNTNIHVDSRSVSAETGTHDLFYYEVSCSYYQIFNEKAWELIDPVAVAAVNNNNNIGEGGQKLNFTKRGTSSTPLRLRFTEKTGAYLEGLAKININSVSEMLAVLEVGMRNRRVASTRHNIHSSRSHAIFVLYVTCAGDTPTEYARETIGVASANSGDCSLDDIYIPNSNFTSNIHLVDLAGSERIGSLISGDRDHTKLKSALLNTCTQGNIYGNTDVKGSRGVGHVPNKAMLKRIMMSDEQLWQDAADKRIHEASDINSSLTALGKVIHVLSTNTNTKGSRVSDGYSVRAVQPSGGLYIPYRDSVLTLLLKNSFGGTARTYMLATVSPLLRDAEETLSTLRFSSRAKMIINTPKVNRRVVSSAELMTLRGEVTALRRRLQATGNATRHNNHSIHEEIVHRSLPQRQSSVSPIVPKTVLLSKDCQTSFELYDTSIIGDASGLSGLDKTNCSAGTSDPYTLCSSYIHAADELSTSPTIASYFPPFLAVRGKNPKLLYNNDSNSNRQSYNGSPHQCDKRTNNNNNNINNNNNYSDVPSSGVEDSPLWCSSPNNNNNNIINNNNINTSIAMLADELHTSEYYLAQLAVETNLFELRKEEYTKRASSIILDIVMNNSCPQEPDNNNNNNNNSDDDIVETPDSYEGECGEYMGHSLHSYNHNNNINNNNNNNNNNNKECSHYSTIPYMCRSPTPYYHRHHIHKVYLENTCPPAPNNNNNNNNNSNNNSGLIMSRYPSPIASHNNNNNNINNIYN